MVISESIKECQNGRSLCGVFYGMNCAANEDCIRRKRFKLRTEKEEKRLPWTVFSMINDPEFGRRDWILMFYAICEILKYNSNCSMGKPDE